MTETMSITSDLLIRALADRTGRDPADLELQVFTAAVLGGAARGGPLLGGQQPRGRSDRADRPGAGRDQGRSTAAVTPHRGRGENSRPVARHPSPAARPSPRPATRPTRTQPTRPSTSTSVVGAEQTNRRHTYAAACRPPGDGPAAAGTRRCPPPRPRPPHPAPCPAGPYGATPRHPCRSAPPPRPHAARPAPPRATASPHPMKRGARGPSAFTTPNAPSAALR